MGTAEDLCKLFDKLQISFNGTIATAVIKGVAAEHTLSVFTPRELAAWLTREEYKTIGEPTAEKLCSNLGQIQRRALSTFDEVFAAMGDFGELFTALKAAPGSNDSSMAFKTFLIDIASSPVVSNDGLARLFDELKSDFEQDMARGVLQELARRRILPSNDACLIGEWLNCDCYREVLVPLPREVCEMLGKVEHTRRWSFEDCSALFRALLKRTEDDHDMVDHAFSRMMPGIMSARLIDRKGDLDRLFLEMGEAFNAQVSKTTFSHVVATNVINTAESIDLVTAWLQSNAYQRVRLPPLRVLCDKLLKWDHESSMHTKVVCAVCSLLCALKKVAVSGDGGCDFKEEQDEVRRVCRYPSWEIDISRTES